MKRKLNKYTEKQLKKYTSKIVRIDWLDIMGEMNKDKATYSRFNNNRFLR